ncbi:YdcF family protein [Sinanaerobacter chloroacetimidivorans]|uniref:YdcF family protein n=1 Tax=Sinanaerobacter chloroacetimidivorans TaxID=2818044 RepID=A0A8J8B5J6_9FIRM|nr:YdcF family protein [Sinanaerobacter chloroacetimidivorans]MBR0600400.1 YdcF family protein [Sinanaerobacter chloroacetimidivorans]
MKKYKRVISILVSIFLIWFVIHTLIITIDGLNDDLGKSDVVVVLGNKIEPNGTPSVRLQGRLNKAIELYEKGYFDYIIVSGGFGKEGYSEAIVMKEYLLEKGISSDCIMVDEEGNDTYSTAKNTKKIMDQRGFHTVTVISQFYHITRTRLAFHKAGLDDVYTVHSTSYEARDIYSLIREFPAYYKYLMI